MTVSGQAAQSLAAYPRFPVKRLADLCALVDTLMASCAGDSPRCKGAGHGESATQSGGSVRRDDADDGASAQPAWRRARPGRTRRAFLYVRQSAKDQILSN